MKRLLILFIYLGILALSGCDIFIGIGMSGIDDSLHKRDYAVINIAPTEQHKGAFNGLLITTPEKSNQTTLFSSLAINLKEAPSFIFVFPDGFRSNSKEITNEMLVAHLALPKMDYEPIGPFRYSEIHPPYPVAEITYYRVRNFNPFGLTSLFKTRPIKYEIQFNANNNGEIISLYLFTCNYTMPKILGTLDGKELFDIPINQAELQRLFGIDTNIFYAKENVNIKYRCDP